MDEKKVTKGPLNKQRIRKFFDSSYKVISSSKTLIQLITEYVNEKDEQKRKILLELMTNVQNGSGINLNDAAKSPE